MKWCGILLIYTACILWGVQRLHALQRRAADLQELCRALEIFRSEIGWRQADLSAIAASHGEVPFFHRWPRALHAGCACMEAAEAMTLSRTDRRLLQEFADCAGKLDRAGQLAQLERTGCQLEKQAAEAREELKSKGRVQLALALCVGGTVSLLLL